MPLLNMNMQLYHCVIFLPIEAAQAQCTKQSGPLTCLLCDWASQLLQTTQTTLQQGNAPTRPITQNNACSLSMFLPRLTCHVLKIRKSWIWVSGRQTDGDTGKEPENRGGEKGRRESK